jgi:hypothetical protein
MLSTSVVLQLSVLVGLLCYPTLSRSLHVVYREEYERQILGKEHMLRPMCFPVDTYGQGKRRKGDVSHIVA